MPRRSPKQIRAKLHVIQNSKCYWCKVTTIEPLPNEMKKGYKIPDNMATLDHIYHTNHKKRNTKNTTGERRYVLACFNCNQKRAKIQQYTDYFVLPNGSIRNVEHFAVSFDFITTEQTAAKA